MEFSFTTKIEYLQYRKEWKEKYLSNVTEIRYAKIKIKETNRNSYNANATHHSYMTKNKANNLLADLIIELKKAKVESNIQRLKNINNS